VRNKGRQTAQNLSGKLIEIRDSKRKNHLLTKPLELNWSENEPIVSLRQGELQYLDIMVINEEYPNTVRFRSKPETPFNREPYYFQIAVYADDAKPAGAEYRVDWRDNGIDDIRMKRVGKFERFLLFTGVKKP
jgi:hypothetical protein